MTRPCINCTRNILFTFIESVIGPSRQCLPIQRSVTRHYLSTEAVATTPRFIDTLPGISNPRGAVSPLLERKSPNVSEWQKQRQGMFGITANKPEKTKRLPISNQISRREKHPAQDSPGSRRKYFAGNKTAIPRKVVADAPPDRSLATAIARKYPRQAKGMNTKRRKKHKGCLPDGTKDRWRRREQQEQANEDPEDLGPDIEAELSTKSPRQAKEKHTPELRSPKGHLPDKIKDRRRPHRQQEQDDEDPNDLGPEIEAELSEENPRQQIQDQNQKPTWSSPTTPKTYKPTPAPLAKPSPNAPSWHIQREAIKRKHNGAVWSPFKKLSPDAMEGVRQLYNQDPILWSTPNLADHFKVSPEAIRRIIKSKWRPNEDERKAQADRWLKRGEAIWDRYVELGRKAPRKWRGLEPLPAEKAVGSGDRKVKVKHEEWSRDVEVEAEEEESGGLGVGLGSRIM